MRILCCLILLLFAAASTPLRASAVAEDTPCTAATATAVGIEAIHADEEAWLDRCVRVRGLYVGGVGNTGVLVMDREALMEQRGYFGEDMRRGIVMLSRSRRALGDRPMQVEVVAVVASCQAANEATAAEMAANPGQIIMVSGYCHTSLATVLNVVSVRVVSRAPVMRLTEADVPPGRRALIPADPALPGYGRAVGAAKATLHALATGDAKAFVRLRVPEPAGKGDIWLREQEGDAYRLFDTLSEDRPLFAGLDRAGDARLSVFSERDAAARVREDPEDWPRLLACWCKTPDCAGRWPVMHFDADNAPRRPYVCVSVNQWVDERGGVVRIQTDVIADTGGFAEPRWPRQASR